MQLNQIPRYKSVTLLQGPVGPFFKKFSKYLKKRNTKVFKINFNLGDDLFYCSEVFRFKGKIEELQNYLENIFIKTSTEAVFLFGGYREIHVEAASIAKKMKIDIWVFEEGYIRPNYITLEKQRSVSSSGKVNLNIKFCAINHNNVNFSSKKYLYVFERMVIFGFLYFTAGLFSHFFYPYYIHHKKFSLVQGLYWLKSFIRKILYFLIDRIRTYKLFRDYKKKYFFVALQVADDFAVVRNSNYKSIQGFIEEVIKSFSSAKEKYSMVVFKHHPMDRGYNQYGRFIAELAKFYGVKDRVLYLHEVNNAKLIKNSCGAVVINSTIGFQTLYYNIPIKVMGKAIYDQKGLTHQGCLDSFWENPQPVSKKLFNQLKNYLIQTCQIPGSFYGRDINELGTEENNVVIYK